MKPKCASISPTNKIVPICVASYLISVPKHWSRKPLCLRLKRVRQYDGRKRRQFVRSQGKWLESTRLNRLDRQTCSRMAPDSLKVSYISHRILWNQQILFTINNSPHIPINIRIWCGQCNQNAVVGGWGKFIAFTADLLKIWRVQEIMKYVSNKRHSCNDWKKLWTAEFKLWILKNRLHVSAEK